MVDSWLDLENCNKTRLKDFNSKFKNNTPFKHTFISNVLNKEKAELLLKALQNENYSLIDEDRGKFYRTKDFHNSKNFILYNFRSFLISKEFREFIHEITGIKIKPNSVDVHAMKMENTHYMLCHTDMELNRKIAFMFYFSENFEEKDGGKLILRDKNLNIVKKLTPQFNSLYVMEITSNSYHDIEEITSKNPRITIGGWFE